MSYLVRNARRAAGQDTWEARNVTERDECFQRDASRKFSTVEVLHAFCDVNGHQLESADEYGEPGYGPAEKGILFCNWNNIPKSLQDRLEAQGYMMEWSDEWYVDGGRSPVKAWRTQPDHRGWESRTRLIDGDILTPDDDPQEWIDSSLNEESNPLPSWFDESELALRGFAKSATGHDPSNRLRNVFQEFTKEGYDVILVNARRYEYDVWTRREAKRELFLSDARGVYIPRDFARSIDRSKLTGVSEEDLVYLDINPEGETYWDVWADVCNDAVITAQDGTVYRLEQDGDLWLVEAAGEFCEHEDTYFVHKE